MPFTAELERSLESAQSVLKLTPDFTGSAGDGALESLQESLNVTEKTRLLDLPLAIQGDLQTRLRTFDTAGSVDVLELVQPEGMEPSDPAELGPLPGSESQSEKAVPPKAPRLHRALSQRRIALRDRTALAQATGLAQLRSVPSGTTRDWEGPLYWRRQGFQAHDIGADSVLPFAA